MLKTVFVFRLIRNFIIALLSSGWILMYSVSLSSLLELLRIREADFLKIESPNLISFSYIELSQIFITFGSITLAIALFFWTFVVVNKLWPIKGKLKD